VKNFIWTHGKYVFKFYVSGVNKIYFSVMNCKHCACLYSGGDGNSNNKYLHFWYNCFPSQDRVHSSYFFCQVYSHFRIWNSNIFPEFEITGEGKDLAFRVAHLFEEFSS
jgi:hypothetical protein